MHSNPRFILTDVEKNFSNSTIYNPLKSPWRRDRLPSPVLLGLPGGSAGKESVINAEDLGLIPGLGRSPGEGEGCPLQYSGLENSKDCTVHGVTKSQTWLSAFHFHYSWFTSWYSRNGYNIVKQLYSNSHSQGVGPKADVAVMRTGKQRTGDGSKDGHGH